MKNRTLIEDTKPPKRHGGYSKSQVVLKPTDKEILREKIRKLKDKEELFPEANQRTKEMIENSNIKDITD
jgi:hypothetical protein